MITISETKDHELIARLNEEVQELHHQLHPEIFKPYDNMAVTAFFKDFLSKSNTKAYIAYIDGLPVGYAVFVVREATENAFQYSQRSIYIDQIMALNAYRRCGAGEQLMKQAEDLACKLSIAKIELDHWTANTVAAAYFRKNGYLTSKEKLWKTIG